MAIDGEAGRNVAANGGAGKDIEEAVAAVIGHGLIPGGRGGEMECQSLVRAEGGGRGGRKEGGARGPGMAAGGRDVRGSGGGLASTDSGTPLEDLELGIVNEEWITIVDGLELVEEVTELGVKKSGEGGRGFDGEEEDAEASGGPSNETICTWIQPPSFDRSAAWEAAPEMESREERRLEGKALMGGRHRAGEQGGDGVLVRRPSSDRTVGRLRWERCCERRVGNDGGEDMPGVVRMRWPDQMERIRRRCGGLGIGRGGRSWWRERR